MAKINSFYFREDQFAMQVPIEYKAAKKRYEEPTFFIRIPKDFDGMCESKEGKRFISTLRIKGNSVFVTLGKTETEAKNNFYEYMRLFIKAGKSSSKVILYKFRFISRNRNSDKQDRFHRERESAELEFDYRICNKVTFSDSSSYQDINKSNNRNDVVTKETTTSTGGYEEWIEIPFSEENEAFFESVYTGMESIMDKFVQFLGTKKNVLKSLESKQLFIN